MVSELEMVAHAASFSRRWRWLALLYIFVGWWTLFSRRPPLPGTHCCIASTVAHWCRQKAINNVACNLFEFLMLLSAMAIKYRYLLLWDSSEVAGSCWDYCRIGMKKIMIRLAQVWRLPCGRRAAVNRDKGGYCQMFSDLSLLSLTRSNKIFIHGGD